MMTSAVESFMSTLRRSNLLGPEQVAVAADLATRSDAVEVARDLISRGWLTEWQARQLLAGKSKLFLGKYKLMDVLGQGGMGAVLKAESTSLRRQVALKVMATNLHDDEIARARFEREIEFSASLNHPNIVRAIDADQIGNRVFLVMEYFSGRDLKAVVKEQGAISIEFACECIRQAALGLQHAFERGIVHRDIKPSNLLVTRDSTTNQPLIKVLDLGLARVSHQAELVTTDGNDFEQTDGGVTRSGQIMGSPDYMSPEQAMSSSTVDIRSDIYGLGVTLFQLLCGELPYSGDNAVEKLLTRINKDAPPVSAFRPDIPPVLVRIVARMLHRDPAQRFQTPAEVAAVMESFVTDPKSLEVQVETAPAALQSIDLPTLDAQADETLNHFLGDLNSQSPVASQPVASRRRKKSVWPLVVSLGTALTVIVAVLFALSQGSGPPAKKTVAQPPKKAAEDVQQQETANDVAPQDIEPSAPVIVPLPPPKKFLSPDSSLARWAHRVAREIHVETSDGEAVVKPADQLPQVTYSVVGLDLRGVQSLSAANLRLLTSGESLRRLNLSGSRLRDYHLTQIVKLKKLRFLDISNTLITDTGVDSLRQCSNLTTLRLKYNSISDSGVASLKHLSLLTNLDLEGTDVTDGAVELLASFKNLERLNLKVTALTPASIDHLRQSMPGCTIEY